MRWSKRIGVGTVIAAGAMAASLGAGSALALVSTSTTDGTNGESAAVNVGGVVKVSDAKASSGGADGGSASWSPVVVAGMSPIDNTPDGWSGPAASLGNLVDQVNDVTCPSSGLRVPVQNGAACVRILSSLASVDGEGSSYGFGDFAEAYIATDSARALATVMEAHAEEGTCESGGGYATPAVVAVGTPSLQFIVGGVEPMQKWLFPLGAATSGCVEQPGG